MAIKEQQGTADRAGRARMAPVQPVVSDRIDGLLEGLSIRKRVAASQLPVTATVALVVIATAIFSPKTFDDNLFVAALLFHLAIAAACFATPWGRLPAGAFAVIPLLDCLAIGFTREAGGPPFNVLSIMLVFPVIWLSVHDRPYMPVLAMAGAVLSTVVPSVVQGSPVLGGSMIRTLILPLVLSVIAVTAHVMATTIRRQRIP